MITFNFNIFPISVNKLYSTRFGQKQRFLTTEGRKFKDVINKEVVDKLQDKELHNIVSSFQLKPLEVTVDIYSPSWLLKDGKTMRRKDLDNLMKALQDSIFSAFTQVHLDLDDSQIWNITMRKHYSTEPDLTKVTISEFDDNM